MTSQADRDLLLTALRERALLRESVVIDGERSSHYFDTAQVLLDPAVAAAAGRVADEILAPAEPAAIGGPVLTAGALVGAVTAAAHARGGRTTGFLVRDEAKRYGLQSWIDGPFIEEGTPVAVVDDVMATGATLVGAIERARAAGGIVVAALAVIDRESGGRDAVEAVLDDAPLHVMVGAGELLGA